MNNTMAGIRRQRDPADCDHDQHLARSALNGSCRDCGEDLYRGFGSLAGMRAVLLGRGVRYDPYANRAALAALTDANGGGRCPSVTTGGGMERRSLRCQSVRSPHEGQCWYHRAGSAGGSTIRWWGANPRPEGYLDDLGEARLKALIRDQRAARDAVVTQLRYELVRAIWKAAGHPAGDAARTAGEVWGRSQSLQAVISQLGAPDAALDEGTPLPPGQEPPPPGAVAQARAWTGTGASRLFGGSSRQPETSGQSEHKTGDRQ